MNLISKQLSAGLSLLVQKVAKKKNTKSIQNASTCRAVMEGSQLKNELEGDGTWVLFGQHFCA